MTFRRLHKHPSNRPATGGGFQFTSMFNKYDAERHLISLNVGKPNRTESKWISLPLVTDVLRTCGVRIRLITPRNDGRQPDELGKSEQK